MPWRLIDIRWISKQTPAYTVQSAFILLKIYANTDIRLSAAKVIVNGFLSCPPHGYRPYIMGDFVAHAKRVPSLKPVINLRVRRCLSFEFYECHQRKRWPNNFHVWSIGFCPVDFTSKFLKQLLITTWWGQTGGGGKHCLAFIWIAKYRITSADLKVITPTK